MNGEKSTPQVESQVTPNQIGRQLILNGKSNQKRHNTGFHNETKITNDCNMSLYTKPFSNDELDRALTLLKSGKAAGPDGILPEMLKNLGQQAKAWLPELTPELPAYLPAMYPTQTL